MANDWCEFDTLKQVKNREFSLGSHLRKPARHAMINKYTNIYVYVIRVGN